MIETFTSETFKEGDVFKVFYDVDKYSEITLLRIFGSKFKYASLDRQPFFLLFKGNDEIRLEAASYKMEQERVGSFEMAITPTAPLKEDMSANYYEAAFV